LRRAAKGAVMKTIGRTALAAFLFTLAANAADDSKNGSLGKRLLGTWTIVSDTIDQGGTKVEPFGPTPKGTMIFASNGQFAIVITRPDVGKFASNNRSTGTPEENKAAVLGGIGYFGTYTVSEPDKTVNLHLDGSTYPNWAGMDQKRVMDLKGDDLTVTNPTSSMGGAAVLVWKRVKDSRRTASAAGPAR
jgi:hypothetical protein